MKTQAVWKHWSLRNIFLHLTLIGCCGLPPLAADTVTGTVRNGTLGQPAANVDVLLLRLDQGMQEEGRTKTDAQGAFTLAVLVPDKPHLVRVVHQGVTYDRQASPGQVVALDVFNAAPKVQGIAGGEWLIRTGTKGDLLHVSDMYEIKNESNPPMTQAGQHTFEAYLPAQAKIDTVLAAGPGGIGTIITATAVPGSPGHYSVNFPIRPGSNKFAFNYDLPYDGHAEFHTKAEYPMQQLAVMTPPTMQFTTKSPAFHVLNTGSKDYLVQAADGLNAGSGPAFVISGTGAPPSLRDRRQGQRASAPSATAPASPAATISAAPITQEAPEKGAAPSSPEPGSPAVRWWVLGGTLLLVVAAGAFLIARRARAGAPAAESQSSGSFVDALKEELFRLETEKLRGAISQQEYEATKRALEGTVKRAAARAEQR